MSSTLVSTTAEANFIIDLVVQCILQEIDLQSFIRPLASCISLVQDESSANQTNVIKKGPPTATNWQEQYQKPKSPAGPSNQH